MARMSSADPNFAARWTLEEIPACFEGFSFLRRLSEMMPHLYDLAHQVGFDNPTDPELKEHPLWLGFVRHYSSCEDCNEV